MIRHSIILGLSICAALPTATHAMSAHETACLYAAADKLTKLSGLIIKEKSVTHLPVEKPQQGAATYAVIITTSFLGEDLQYSFACATGAAGTFVSQSAVSK